MQALDPLSWTFQNVAHRGFRGHYAENTLLAFEKALEYGATMLELDVRMTRDEVIVVMHDPTLMRLGTNHGHVSDFLWEELKEMEIYDAKARHVQSGRVLNLERLFQCVGDNTHYYLEIKTSRKHPVSHAHRLCDLLVDMVLEHELQNHVLFCTFQFHLLEYLHEHKTPNRLGYNFEHQWLGLANYPKLQEMNAIVCPDHNMLTRERFDEIKEHGLQVIPWVINDQERMRELIEWGVDGITTDFPDRLTELLLPSE